jgi:23S rRNA (uracil1939-C5)-methyltransferase
MVGRQPRRLDVLVTGLSEEGLGIAEAEHRTLRIRDALPGEQVRALVRKRRGGVWFAQAESRDSAAPERVQPPCAAFPRCGGCALQHVDYDAQLAHKHAMVLGLLAAQGIEPAHVRAPVSGPRFHYRYKARLGVRLVDGQLLVGFREPFGNRVARMNECVALAAPLATALPDLARTLDGLEVRDRIPQVEVAAGDAGAAFIVRHLVPLTDADTAALARFEAAGSRRVYLQPEGYDSIRGLRGDMGMDWLEYGNPEFGLSFQFLPTDFTQVNPVINRALVQSAVIALDPAPGDRVADLFCGIGNFSLALARRGAYVRGYESGEGAVARAWHNAARNGLCDRAEFAVQDLYDPSGAELAQARLMLIDPPRSGAGPNLRTWTAGRTLERIAYVSCNPRTFASDAAVLRESGFALAQLGVFDMFPHTAHVETLGLFVRSR